MCGAPCVPSKSLVRQLKVLYCTKRTYSRYIEHVCFFSQKHRLPSWLKVSKDFPGSPASPRLQHVPKNKHGRQQRPIQLLSFQASLFPLHPLCTGSAGVYWRFFQFLSTSKLSCCMVCSSPLWNKIRVANRIKEFIEKTSIVWCHYKAYTPFWSCMELNHKTSASLLSWQILARHFLFS